MPLIADDTYASAVAPVIDRLRLAVMERTRPAMVEVGRGHGIGEDGGRTLAMVRNTRPGVPVAVAGIHALFCYLPPVAVTAGIDELCAAGLAERDGDDLMVTSIGHDVLAVLARTSATVAGDLWSSTGDVDSLAGLTAIAVRTARASGGPAFAVVAPADRSDAVDGSPAAQLAEDLTALRFHRFDSHVAAWRSVGLDAREAQALEAGPRRDAIESDTNRRAGAAYRDLDDDQRLALLAGLAALRG